jgi:UDP-glucose 4-epimerase
MNILVTGGAGFIGSHTIVELLEVGHRIIILDNLTNSKEKALDEVAKISNRRLITKKPLTAESFDYSLVFIKGDLRDRDLIRSIFLIYSIEVVVHFAGLKSVGESVIKPLDYYSNNVVGSFILFDEMQRANIKTLVFSSSAAVYGDPFSTPITEKFSTENVTSPYGRSKLIIENMLKDLYMSDKNWKIILLRYFNPAGAHPSAKIGENPNGVPDNLIPFISQVASGKLDKLKVYGGNYPTIDGTGVRDYIHVMDLAKGHVAALNFISKQKSRLEIVNLGTGKGTSVLQVIKAFESATGKKIPFEIVERRPGDVAECWTSTKYAESTLGWSAELNIEKMCKDAWLWQIQCSQV